MKLKKAPKLAKHPPAKVRVKVKAKAAKHVANPVMIRRIGTERDVIRPTRTMVARRARVTEAERHSGIEARPLNIELAAEGAREARRSSQLNMERRMTTVSRMKRTNEFSGDRRYNTLGELGFSFGDAFKDIGSTFADATKQAITQIGGAAVQSKVAKNTAKRQAALLSQQRDIAEQQRLASEAEARAAESQRMALTSRPTPYWQDPKMMLGYALVLALVLWRMKKKRG